MPGIDDWKTKPYGVIQQIFDDNRSNTHDAFLTQVEDYFNQRINNETVLEIPSLNDCAVDTLRPGSIVRYRCMIQDVFDPQFCLGQYIVRNNDTQETRLECGYFRDTPNLAPNESADMDSQENKPIERTGFYCVPIPGEAEWVKQLYSKKGISPTMPSTSSLCNKRKMEDNERQENSIATKEMAISEQKEGGNGNGTTKIQKGNLENRLDNKNSDPGTGNEFAHNFPLPKETGTPCIVRVYSSKEDLKLTNVVEFVGILSVDPALASVCEETDGVEELMEQEELRAHEPPPSLVPRIHALLVRRISHNNPYLSPFVESDSYKAELQTLMQDSGSIRMELHSILQHALLGDVLASEYLICHLLSRVYARTDSIPVGKLSLNLSGCPVNQRYSLFLNHLISQLTTKSTLMEMSIENMNSWRLIPKKDYKANRVTAGILQLSSGTQIVLDETALQQGQLDNSGVLNVQALEELSVWQKVSYDFQWSRVPIPSDTNVLILSECTSLLSKDIIVPMETNSVSDVPSYFSLLDKRLTEEILLKLRSYITACRLIDYEITEDVQKIIQDDFVETRQANPSEMSVEDFQRLLTLLRLLTLSFGMEKPSLEIWRKAKAMEEQRKARVSKLPKPSNGTA